MTQLEIRLINENQTKTNMKKVISLDREALTIRVTDDALEIAVRKHLAARKKCSELNPDVEGFWNERGTYNAVPVESGRGYSLDDRRLNGDYVLEEDQDDQFRRMIVTAS